MADDLPERVLALAISGVDPGWVEQTEAAAILDRLPGPWHLCGGRDCPDPVHADPLPQQAGTRAGDPDVSRLAAASITNMPDRYRDVIACLATFPDPPTYDDLCDRYAKWVADGLAVHQSDPSVRSRCATLRHARWIAPAGKGKSHLGRTATRWKIIRPIEDDRG